MSGLAALLSNPDPDHITSCLGNNVCSIDVDLKYTAALAAARLAFSAAADAVASRVQSKADAWAHPLPFGSSNSGSACPLGFSNPAVYKQYPTVHLPSTASLLTPRQLLWLFLKNSGIVLLLQVGHHCYV